MQSFTFGLILQVDIKVAPGSLANEESGVCIGKFLTDIQANILE
jgi:hypothetical protein